MRLVMMIAVVMAPLAATADVSLETPSAAPAEALARCAAAVRRALRTAYASDDGDWSCVDRVADGGGSELYCVGACDDWSCHNDACEGHSSSLELVLERSDGAPTKWSRDPDRDGETMFRRRFVGVDARLTTYVARRDDLARTLVADMRAQSALARRVLDACLAQ